MYIEEEMSQADIGDIAGVSRTTVSNRMKKCGIQARSKSAARIKALEKGKLDHDRHVFNRDLLFSFSPRSSYVMGVIWAAHAVAGDGKGLFLTCGASALSVTVRAVELLESNKSLSKYYNNDYPAWRIYFHGEDIVDRLLDLGMDDSTVPRGIPENYIHHFVRGYWERRGFTADGKRILMQMKQAMPEHESHITHSGWYYLHIDAGAERIKSWLYDDAERQTMVRFRRDGFLNDSRIAED